MGYRGGPDEIASEPVPAALMTREEIVHRLREAFRTYGYEGATLARLTEATGLGRGSLYHHFPRGKEEMAEVVLATVADWFDRFVFAPLREEAVPADGVAAMLANLEGFYRGGEASCLAGSLALGEARESFAAAVRRIFEQFIGELTDLGVRVGRSPADARRAATDAVVRIEGALVVSRGTKDMTIFTATLRALPAQLLGPTSAS